MKQLTLEDYSLIKPFLDLANYEGYNSNFVTMMMWNHEYHIQYEIHDHFLIMLHHYKDVYFWAMPFTSPQYYDEALHYMIQYSKEHHFEFIIDCAIEDFVIQLKQKTDHPYIFERTPYNDDYVYDRHMLQTLSGKKMQKRRNHFNAFKKNYPQYEYRDLDETKDFDTILECLTRWEKDKDSMSESMTSEIYGIMYLLSSKHLLDIKVGGIFIDDVMEAFIIASPLKHQTIQIHVEKANKNIRGLYPAILKELLERHFPGYLYVNREEDMGLENLRKAKQDLHPVKMITKYQVTLKNISISQAKQEDQKDIEKLWLEQFSDENELSTQFYFQNCYHKDNTYVLKQNNQLLSVCQIIPYKMMIQQQQTIYYFIEGVCTRKNFEKQGLMKTLLHYVFTLPQYNNQKIYLQAYHPDIYRPFGFHISHYLQCVEVDKQEYQNQLVDIKIKEASSKEFYSLYQHYTSSYDEYRIRDVNYYENYLMRRNKALNQNINMFQVNNKNIGYTISEETEDRIIIYEIIYLNQESLDYILTYYAKNTKRIIVYSDLQASIKGQKKDIQNMMSRQLSKDRYSDHYFINEIY